MSPLATRTRLHSLLHLFPSISRPLCSSPAAETRTQKLERIADELIDLNRLERYDYSILFSLKLGLDRWGLAPAVNLGSPSAREAVPTQGASAEEKTSFDIKLEKFDAAAKLKVIKEVRGFMELGLKEAKDLVEKAPVVVKKQVVKEEAKQIAAKLKEIGATVVLE